MIDIANIIKTSKNKLDALKKLNWDTKTYGYRKLNKYINDNNIDITHYNCGNLKIFTNRLKIPIELILVSGSTYQSTSNLKKRLYKENIKNPICEECGQDENWHGKHISMILDHINGIYDDNRIENLRILCPNCNAALPTHCGKNIKRSVKKLKKLPYDIKYEKKKMQSIKTRIYSRPDFEQLKLDIDKLGYSATGRKYYVSDNTIRKWIKFYEKYDN